MKKTIVASTLVVFVLYGFVSIPQVEATVPLPPSTKNATDVLGKTVATSGATMDATSPETVDYALPYPGILPDHPLYILKRLRDAILDKLIVDPARKAEFYILQSDKHLNMTIFLLDKGKGDHAVGTTRASVQFLEKAVGIMTKSKEDGKAVPEYLRDRAEKSAAKHAEVFTGLAQKAEGQAKEVLTQAVSTSTGLRDQAMGLK